LGGISHLLQAAQDSRRTGRRNMGRSDVRCCARTGMGTGAGVNARNSALIRSNASSNLIFFDTLRARARWADSPTFIAILSLFVGTNEAPATMADASGPERACGFIPAHQRGVGRVGSPNSSPGN
jgi:hypothetical protein